MNALLNRSNDLSAAGVELTHIIETTVPEVVISPELEEKHLKVCVRVCLSVSLCQ